MIYSAPPPDVSANADPLPPEVVQSADSALATVPNSSHSPESSSLARPSQQEAFTPEYSHTPTVTVESPTSENPGEPIGVDTSVEPISQSQAELLDSGTPVSYFVQGVEQSDSRENFPSGTELPERVAVQLDQNSTPVDTVPAFSTTTAREIEVVPDRAHGQFRSLTPVPENGTTEPIFSKTANSSQQRNPIAQNQQPTPQPASPETPSNLPSDGMLLREIRVTGSTVFSPDELNRGQPNLLCRKSLKASLGLA